MELKPVRTDDQPSGRGVTYESTHDVAATESGRRVLRNVYLLLAASLVPTAIGALLGANLDLSFLRASPIISSFAILGIFYGWIFAIEKNRNSGLGVAFLLGFTAFMGVLMGPLLQVVRGGETNYISATLSLYVALYNLFTSLLQLLGIFGGSRD